MQTGRIYSFDRFRLDVANRQLLRDENPVSLPAKAFDLLTTLVENNGRLVAKDELINAVWNDQIVEESNLTVYVSQIRKALGETKSDPRFVETVPGFGYRFVGEVDGADDDELIFETETLSRVTIENFREDATPPQRLTPPERWNQVWRFVWVAGIIVIAIAGFAWYRTDSPRPASSGPVKPAKLTTSGRILNASMSPDGKFAVFAQKEDGGEGLWLHQIESGSQTQIVPPKPIQYVGLTISSDNQSIYASIFSKNEIDTLVHKIPILGGVSQPIPNLITGASVSISPDGKRFAFTASDSGLKETYLGVYDADGNTPRYVLTAKDDIRFFRTFGASPLAWSPDGAGIAAAVFKRNETGSDAAIILVDPDTGTERDLTGKRWSEVDNLAWLDTDRLAFIATEQVGLEDQVWILSTKTGEVKQLTSELQSYSRLSANNGSILAVKSNVLSSLRVADFNENEKALTNRELYNASEHIDSVDWSANGDILFVLRASGKPEIWRIGNEGSKPAQLTVDANAMFGLAVSPIDGSMVYGSKLNGKSGLWKVDAEGKNLRRVSEGPDHSPDLSNDGKMVFQRGFNHSEGVFVASADAINPRLIREKCLFPAISSDGKMTACYFMDWEEQQKWKIALISSETGELIRRISLPIPVYERQIRFHPSGKYITQLISNGENLSLLLIPVDGSEIKILNGLGKGESHLAEWSADGKQFLYPFITETRDAVLLTDF